MLPPELVDRICRRLARALAPRREAAVAFRIDDRVAGRLTRGRAERLDSFRATFRRDRDGSLRFAARLDTLPARSAALAEVSRALAAEGALTAWRDELYAVAPAFGAPPWLYLERAAARYFGVRTYAAHVNGLVRDGPDVAMWVARRSLAKPIDPGMLDNLVGGGVAAGTGVTRTVIKESWEEAGIPAPLASRAQPAGILHVERWLPDGLQDEILFAHDLWLPPGFTPANQDGEAVEQHKLSLAAVAALLGQDDTPDATMTVDASLVALMALVRGGCFDAPGRAKLVALLRRAAGTF